MQLNYFLFHVMRELIKSMYEISLTICEILKANIPGLQTQSDIRLWQELWPSIRNTGC